MSTVNKGTAIVTGASSGIGEIYAERLADRGFDLVLVARSSAKLEAQATRLAARTGQRVEALAADLSTTAGQLLVEARLRADASVTLLVNNAGSAASGPLAGANPGDLAQMIEINITALTRLSAAAAAAFGGRGQGAIINIASAMAFITTASAAAYAATKAYVLHLSNGLREELAPQGVTVQAVLPGYTRTPFLSDSLLSTIPASMLMPVEELVDAALAGLDKGEAVTIPSLLDPAAWQAFEAARQVLATSASRDHPAPRYLAS